MTMRVKWTFEEQQAPAGMKFSKAAALDRNGVYHGNKFDTPDDRLIVRDGMLYYKGAGRSRTVQSDSTWASTEFIDTGETYTISITPTGIAISIDAKTRPTTPWTPTLPPGLYKSDQRSGVMLAVACDGKQTFIGEETVEPHRNGFKGLDVYPVLGKLTVEVVNE